MPTYGKLIPIVVLILFIAHGCANFKLHSHDPKGDSVHEELIPSNKISRIFLIGDAGEITDHAKKVMPMLRKMALEEKSDSKVIFLGDNLYPIGLPKKSSETYQESAEKLSYQVSALDGYEQDVIFIPGNHDWAKGRVEGLKNLNRQEEFLRDEYPEHVRMLPAKGCPGPEIIEIDKDHVIIIIDSQWWLQDWDRTKGIHQKCEIRSRHDFIAEFHDAIQDHEEKQIIIALHHPLYSNGSHGGYFSFEEHLMPLGKIGFKIPLPVLGSVYPIMRGTFGNVQDIPHPKYQDLKKSILAEVGYLEDVVFASGHEHSLQYQEHHGHHFIGSGSGAKEEPLRNTKDLIYGHAKAGFFTLDLYPEGKMVVQAWEAVDTTGVGKMAFRKVIQRALKKAIPELSEMEKQILTEDSLQAIISSDYRRNGFYKFLFGEHYRDLYDLPVSSKVMHLDRELGGMEILKKGGGMQTSSLRLVAPSGQQYVLRGLHKDASGLLPDIFQGTFALEILQDQLSASHPYGAFVIPDLAEAAGIYHTNPELRYLPAQNVLGKYNTDFANELYLFEERPAGNGSGISSFGNSTKIISTADLIELSASYHNHLIDTRFVIRNRIFDMWIGDWDRHDDQWRWASFKSDGGTIYRPIPRDRDQAFSEYDGLVSRIAYAYLPTFRKFGPFRENLPRLKWFNYNARYFDRYFISDGTKKDWQEIAKEIQTNLDDLLIDRSINLWSAEIRQRMQLDISSILKKRRSSLVNWAEAYYDFLAKEVDVRGTDKKEKFEVTRNDDGTTEVKVYALKKGQKREQQYARKFFPAETKRIFLFGLGQDDVFEIDGKAKNGIKLSIIGGDGHDRYTDLGRIDIGRRKGIHIWDEHKPVHERNQFSKGTRYTEIGENEVEYERNRFRYDFGLPLFLIGFNPDEGFILGLGYEWTDHGFQKSPFASKHTFQTNYGFGNQAFKASYDGVFNQAIGSADFIFRAMLEGPSYVQNYYGLGNTSLSLFEDNRNYHRVLNTRYGVYPGIRKRLSHDQAQIGLNVFAEHVSIERSIDRFIARPAAQVDPAIFEGVSFLGGSTFFQYEMKDHPVRTTRGIRFRLEYGVRQDLTRDQLQHFFKSELRFYYHLKTVGKPVIATRIGFETNGGDFDFYNASTLGGNSNFRGFPNNRLTGKKAFYQNIDVRYQLFSYKSYLLPAAVGISLNFDHGRIWIIDDTSKVWHYSYGGGIWISPFNELLLNVSYNVSDLDQRITGTLGFFF